MMTSVEFDIWCNHLKLNEQARKQIEKIRSEEPSRRVGGKNNVCGRYPSQKMGVTIQFESHRNELGHIYQLEYDEDVLEYYDQPPPIFLDYLSKSGRRNYHKHTPDTFVIRKEECGWEEYKTEKELFKKLQESPNRWQRTPEGKWLCAPGTDVASQFGFYYVVRSEAQINSTFLRNFIWLSDYFHSSKPLSVKEELTKSVRTLVSQKVGITLAQIIQQTSVSIDDLNILITTNQIYVDLKNAFLGKPEKVRVYLDQDEALTYKNLALNTNNKLWELSGHSVRELMIAASELRKLNKIHFQKFGEITAKKLVAFFKRIEMKEALLTPPWLSAKKAIEQQRLKDAELKQVIAIVEGKSIEVEHIEDSPNFSAFGDEQQPILSSVSTEVKYIAQETVNETFEPLEEW